MFYNIIISTKKRSYPCGNDRELKKSVSQIDRKPYKIRFEFRKVQTSSVPACRNPRQGSHRSVFPSPSLLCYLISVEFSK